MYSRWEKLNLQEGQDLLTRSVYVLAAFMLFNCLLVFSYKWEASVPELVADFFVRAVPAVSKPIEFLNEQYDLRQKEIFLRRAEVVEKIYALQWSFFSVFFCFWLIWIISGLVRIGSLYSNPGHHAYEQLHNIKMTLRMLYGLILISPFVIYSFYETYFGNYKFSYYNPLVNNVHSHDLSFYRYGFFMFTFMLFLSIALYGICLLVVSLKHNSKQ